MVFLQAFHRHPTFLQRANATRARPGRPDSGHDRDALTQGGCANFYLILTRRLAARGINDELNLTVLDQVAHVRPALRELE